ncbi:Wzz/FepE/Etk N-terminal domain-containing protein [Streptosporangium sp. NPDC048865]|uniref:Wzz/FepE/Etk N-terminal domain-containing protein n=1 Tax=Streptosporangium sp. NPDC048865 TaxID=3155766 RepID=UPI00341C9AA0
MSPSPDAPARRGGEDLADYASLLRRRWPIVLSLLLAGAGCGLALLWLTPPSYTASGQVLVTATGSQEQTNQVTGRQREPLNLDTEAQVARSAVVAAKARALFGGLPCAAGVSVPPNTSVLEISCAAADPKAAASGANAYALAYLAQRRESSAQALTAQLKIVLLKLRQAGAGLTKVATELPGLGRGTAERTLALQRQNVLTRQVHGLTARYDALKTVAVTPGSVISQATVPTVPTAPRPPLYLGSGLMAGLLCGVGIAWLRDRLDTALRTAADVGRLTGLDIVDGGEGHDLAGAVLVVAVPGTSSREVRDAVRSLNDRGVPVVGAFVIGDEAPSSPGPPSVSSPLPPPAQVSRAPRTSRASHAAPASHGSQAPPAPRSGGSRDREGLPRRAARPLAGLANGPASGPANGPAMGMPGGTPSGMPGGTANGIADGTAGVPASGQASGPAAPEPPGETPEAPARPGSRGTNGTGPPGAAGAGGGGARGTYGPGGAYGSAGIPEAPPPPRAYGNVPPDRQAAAGRRGRRS